MEPLHYCYQACQLSDRCCWRFDENHIYHPFFWGCCISLFPSTEQLGPVTCELTLSLHSLFLLLLTCFCHHLPPPPPPPPPSLTPHPPSLSPRWSALLSESLCIKGRGDVSCQPIGSREEVCLQISGSRVCVYVCVFLWRIQPDNRRIRGREDKGGALLKKTQQCLVW